MTKTKTHWNAVYGEKSDRDVSWFQPEAQPSLELILLHRNLANKGVVDVGAGASRLVDGLLAANLTDVTLLDVAEAAFAPVRERLGSLGNLPTYVMANAIDWQPKRQFGIWHDRAMFHFLTRESEQDRYLATLDRSLVPGGIAILATFAPDGPEFCSGLPVQRYSYEEIKNKLGPSYVPIKAIQISHSTPRGSVQSFQYALFRKTG